MPRSTLTEKLLCVTFGLALLGMFCEGRAIHHGEQAKVAHAARKPELREIYGGYAREAREQRNGFGVGAGVSLAASVVTYFLGKYRK